MVKKKNVRSLFAGNLVRMIGGVSLVRRERKISYPGDLYVVGHSQGRRSILLHTPNLPSLMSDLDSLGSENLLEPGPGGRPWVGTLRRSLKLCFKWASIPV